MKYDKSYEPPAPIAEISLRNTQTGKRSAKFKALLDTGADISLLPLSAISEINIHPTNETVNLPVFDESKSVAEIYNFQIIFLGKRIIGNYCAINDETGILGRDILNEFSINFDGENLDWKECVR